MLDQTLGPSLRGGRDYIRLLQVLHALHAEADPLLERWVRTSQSFRHLTIATRMPALASDLTALGMPPLERIQLHDLPRTSPGLLTDPAGVALLYVIAGSSIGARVILRSLPLSVPQNARNGLTQGASTQSAALWSGLLTLLARPAPAIEAASAHASCSLVFERILSHLERGASLEGRSSSGVGSEVKCRLQQVEGREAHAGVVKGHPRAQVLTQ